MKIKKKMTKNDLNDINTASDIKCHIMTLKIKMSSTIDIFMLKVSINSNFSMNYVFSLLHL